jgi:hypothetical protein
VLALTGQAHAERGKSGMQHQRTSSGDGVRQRRSFIRSVTALAAALLPVPRALAVLYGGADEAGAAFPPNDVRHYGILPNSPAAASANTAALKTLVNPAGTFTGNLSFPNTTGTDVYYFNDLIAFHDGIHLDLEGSTLSFAKTGAKSDSASGFIHAIRNFVIENGTIVTNYVFKGGYDAGNVLAFGGRGRDTALFPDTYDRLLSAPMGNIVVRNLHIKGGTSGGDTRGIFMLGGFDGVLIDGVTIDGQGQLTQGIYYEFGWATNEPQEPRRYTSHAINVRVSNLTVTNVVDEAFGAMGAYDIVIDGLRLYNVGHGCLIGTGESLYYRPWVPSGDLSKRPRFVARNVSGEAIIGMGIGVTGASKVSGSYLSNPPAYDNPLGITADQQTDLIDFVLDGFSLSGSLKNFGVWTSTRIAQISNGNLTGFQRGIVTTQECTQFGIERVKIWESGSFGILIGQGISIHVPPRLATGAIRDCVIAGSGSQGPCAGLYASTTRSCLIEGCRFGYDQAMDGRGEATQTQAVSVGADAAGVVCRNDNVAATANGAVAYLLAGPPGRGCRIEGPRGIRTASGAWS